MPELILAIDVGTTSTRAALLTPGGAFLGLARAPLRSHLPVSGRVEQDAEAVWRATRSVIARCMAATARAPADIAAIGLTTQRASAVIWDRLTGRALSPLVIWSDLRGAARARELAASGFMLAPQQSATKLEGIVGEIDLPLSDVAWGNIDSFLIWKLTAGAVHATDRSQAWPSGYLGFPDLAWNQRLIAHQGLEALAFPKLVDTWGPIGHTSASVLGGAIPITANIADQQAALVAHGEDPGVAKFTFGTSATFDLATGADFLFPAPSVPPLVVSSTAGETRFCVEGMVLSAGSALDWLREVCALGSPERLEALAASAPDAGGAAFLPALQGLGAPRGDPRRRGSLTGLSASVTRAHLARAGLEGVAFRARDIVDSVYSLAGKVFPEALGIDGGLTASALFQQILADLLGRPIRRHAIPEASLLGAALSAGRGVGLLSLADRQSLVRYDATVAPRISPDEAHERFTKWHKLTRG